MSQLSITQFRSTDMSTDKRRFVGEHIISSRGVPHPQAEPYEPHSIPPNWGGPKFNPGTTQNPRENFDLPIWYTKH